ncbi:histidine kinase [Spirosoma sp. HMF4905]|uniref:Histidine kinase n=1 Tax=Spirosoma arboris TaxID=2682092 RepID=A0A7K1SEG9_9BACT|nr:histidine kinase [Spirosoma arboris]MVM32192.1 histidine kinase [Spirosoma arboris]
MDSSTAYNLTLAQKLGLALSVFAIYWPIKLYIILDRLTWGAFQRFWWVWLLEISITLLFFTFWLSLSEWFERWFAGWSGWDFLVNIKTPAKLVTLVVAGALAIVLNFGFYNLWSTVIDYVHRSDYRLHKAQPAVVIQAGPVADTIKALETKEFQQRERFNHGLTVMAMLSAFYLAANLRGYKKLEDLRVNAEQLKREATQAQFSALKNQVNPHFLFNSLSILSTLVEVDTKLSVQFISRLAKAYRYILDQREMDQVSLKTELEFLDAYLFLLNIRFKDKLKVNNKLLPQEASRYKIAPLTLQLLVENAVKHNQMSIEHPLIISIYKEDDVLLIANPIQLRPVSDSSTGMGLQNITNRYGLLTDRPVWIGEQNSSFVVKIPLLS